MQVEFPRYSGVFVSKICALLVIYNCEFVIGRSHNEIGLCDKKTYGYDQGCGKIFDVRVKIFLPNYVKVKLVFTIEFKNHWKYSTVIY